MPQTFKNHRRWYPTYHFVVVPILWPFSLYTAWLAVREPNRTTIVTALVAFAVALVGITARVMAIRVQNRVIRLEMRLRLREILPAALHPRIAELTTRQLVGLRFAGDAELPALVTRTLNGEFPSSTAIKRAITDWQPDYLRV